MRKPPTTRTARSAPKSNRRAQAADHPDRKVHIEIEIEIEIARSPQGARYQFAGR